MDFHRWEKLRITDVHVVLSLRPRPKFEIIWVWETPPIILYSDVAIFPRFGGKRDVTHVIYVKIKPYLISLMFWQRRRGFKLFLQRKVSDKIKFQNASKRRIKIIYFNVIKTPLYKIIARRFATDQYYFAFWSGTQTRLFLVWFILFGFLIEFLIWNKCDKWFEIWNKRKRNNVAVLHITSSRAFQRFKDDVNCTMSKPVLWYHAMVEMVEKLSKLRWTLFFGEIWLFWGIFHSPCFPRI